MTKEDRQTELAVKFDSILTQYQLSYGNELEAKKKRLDGIIGDSHWLSVGTYKENILRNLLRNRLPPRFEIGSGFVLSTESGERKISKQVDILIWDHEHAPLFRDGEFVIVTPEAVRAAIAVKSTLDHGTLDEAIDNLDSLSKFYSEFDDRKVLVRAVFAYSLGDDMRFPIPVFRKLHKFVHRVDRSTVFQKHSDFESAAWISFIGVLGVGCIEQLSLKLNGKEQHVYFAFNTSAKSEGIDSYSALERRLLLDLTLGYKRDCSVFVKPGFVNLDRLLKMVPMDGQCYMPFWLNSVEKFIELGGETNGAWCARAFCLAPQSPPQIGESSL